MHRRRFLEGALASGAISTMSWSGLFSIPALAEEVKRSQKSCILLWPRSYLDAYTEGQSADPLGNLVFNRNFYSQMIFRSFDKTGRIVLPGELAERFPEREIAIVGAGRYLELWRPADFESSLRPLEFE